MRKEIQIRTHFKLALHIHSFVLNASCKRLFITEVDTKKCVLNHHYIIWLLLLVSLNTFNMRHVEQHKWENVYERMIFVYSLPRCTYIMYMLYVQTYCTTHISEFYLIWPFYIWHMSCKLCWYAIYSVCISTCANFYLISNLTSRSLSFLHSVCNWHWVV